MQLTSQLKVFDSVPV